MNIMDLLVIGLLLLYFLSGMYRGFLPSLLNLGSFFLSWIGSFIGYKFVSKAFMNSEVISSLQFYVEGAERVGNFESARRLVAGLPKADLQAIMDNANLPGCFDRAISANIRKEAFADLGLETVGEYFNMTIFSMALNIVAFILLFWVLKCLFTLISNSVSYSADLPQLKKFEFTAGGGVTLLRGFFTMHVIFMLIPVAMALFPASIAEMLNSSLSSSIFYSGNILLPFISGVV